MQDIGWILGISQTVSSLAWEEILNALPGQMHDSNQNIFKDFSCKEN